MIKDDIGYLANYFWRESLNNIQAILTLDEVKYFSGNDYYYLTTIYHMNQPNLSEVAEALDMTKPAISALYRKLNKIGLLNKIQSKEDKRMFHLEVTSKGEKIVLGDERMYEYLEEIVKSSIPDQRDIKLFETVLEQTIITLKENMINNEKPIGK
jgi:DNA-binding MarR family transcriptional regulator